MSVLSLVEEQYKAHKHEWVDWHDLIRRIATDKELSGSFVGSYSLTTKGRQLTYVSTRHSWCGKPISASTIARKVLQIGLNELGRKRILWNKTCLPFLSIPQPLFAIPQGEGSYLVYVDIKSCYYDIYRRMPFDFFWNGYVPVWGSLWFKDFLPEDIANHKLVRNSVIGCMRVEFSRTVRNYKVVETGNRNNVLSPCHWGFIAHLLHIFARMAVDCNAVYFNTDGAIFKSDEDADKWIQQINDLGFVCNLKAKGLGWVDYPGAYKIGDVGNCVRRGKIKSYSNLLPANWYVLTAWEKFC